MVPKWTGSGLEVSVRVSVHPKYFPYLLDESYARDLQAQGACALRFYYYAATLNYGIEVKTETLLFIFCEFKFVQIFGIRHVSR